MCQRSFARQGLRLFAMLSVADLVLTCCLIRGSNGLIYESNPLAAWFLRHLGWMGLAGFKVLAFLIACGLILLLFRLRPRAAQAVLVFGCLMVGGVVSYSCSLAANMNKLPHNEERVAQLAAEKRSRDLERRVARFAHFSTQISFLGKEVAAGNQAFEQALDQLEQSSQTPHPDWPHRCAEEQPGLTVRDRLKARLLREIRFNLRDFSLAEPASPTTLRTALPKDASRTDTSH